MLNYKILFNIDIEFGKFALSGIIFNIIHYILIYLGSKIVFDFSIKRIMLGYLGKQESMSDGHNSQRVKSESKYDYFQPHKRNVF